MLEKMKSGATIVDLCKECGVDVNELLKGEVDTMKTMELCDGVTLTASDETLEYARWALRSVAYGYDVTDSDYAALQRARDSKDWDFYSDLYKDMYGVRPVSW